MPLAVVPLYPCRSFHDRIWWIPRCSLPPTNAVLRALDHVLYLVQLPTLIVVSILRMSYSAPTSTRPSSLAT